MWSKTAEIFNPYEEISTSKVPKNDEEHQEDSSSESS